MPNSTFFQRTWHRLADPKATISVDSDMTQRGQDIREENLPESGDDIVEWKEGPDMVIEKRGAPGEDVEVTVIKNAYAKHPVSNRHHNHDSGVEGTLHDAKGRISHAPNDLMKNLEHAGHDAEAKVKQSLHH
ncbi:hypothetical protein QCA50_005202 [Cerrena zonata]|uniref:Hypervirulence associated protein TUDOR domain-containing protein n=1 Tax=Cerrena zonata TaxID=2478898 RepID=A0AAW0GJ31_9APHY